MVKRGMSLLISFVLLVGFTILMAAFITTWSVNRVKDIPLDGLGGVYCDDVRIDVTLRNKGVDTLDIDVVNEGVFTVNRLTIQRETYTASDARPLASCIVLNTGLVPGATITKTLRLGRINEVFGDQVIECDSIQSESTCISVRSLAIVPWVSIEGEDIACNDRKVSFSGEDYSEILRFCP